jgi:hypothetical protein
VAEITAETSLEELGALVSQALERVGISATLSGGGAVTVYAENLYMSGDLDFVTSAQTKDIAAAIAPLGFHRARGAREFEHPQARYYVEFPSGPLGFGDTVISDRDATTIETVFGPLRIVTPTQILMDRIAAFVHWNDNPSFDQAVMVARRQQIDWSALYTWAANDRIDAAVIDELRRSVGQG